MTRRRCLAWAPVGTAAVAIVLLAGTLGERPLLARGATAIRAFRARAARSALPPERAPFAGLAASQVGYGPEAAKQFSSPRPFGAFSVRRVPGGDEVFRGGGPLRSVQAETLGAIRAVWIGDFSGLRAPGRYRLEADNGLASDPFDVRPDVFDPVVRAVQRALYYQRAFTAIEQPYAAGPWVHGSDAGLAPAGVARGWHDAGDFSIYSPSANSALFWLLSAYADFSPGDDDTGIPESGNGLPDLLDEARWGLEWLLSVQRPGGGFEATTCQNHYGPYGTNRPESMAPYVAGPVSAVSTARAVGTLAFAAAVQREVAPAFAQKCLAAARAGSAFLRAHPEDQTDDRHCPSSRLGDEPVAGPDARMYAAAGMLLATGEPEFARDFETAYRAPRNDPSFLRFNVYAALLYLRAGAGDPARRREIWRDLRVRADEVFGDGQAHPFQWAGRYFWGSIAAGFQRTAAFSAPFCLDAPERTTGDCEQALANVHHALGRNFQQRAYVSGLPGVTRGRERAFHHWLAALDARPFLFPGLVAGGPVAEPEPLDVSVPGSLPIPLWGYWEDPAMPRGESTPVEGRYTDNDSWSTNEIDVEWQAVALYDLLLARWWSAGASGERRPALPMLP